MNCDRNDLETEFAYYYCNDARVRFFRHEYQTEDPQKLGNQVRPSRSPTNIASVNLVMGCSKVFFFTILTPCPGVLTLCK